jgi:type IV pilus assembly protein PilA
MRRQRGWNLLELAIVMAVIAILASIAIPSYGHVLMRAAVNGAIDWAQPVTELMEANAKAGLPVAEGFTPTSNPLRRVEAIDIVDETIVITLAGGTVVLQPVGALTDTVVGWSCTGGTLAANFRPSACRGGS